MKAPLPIVFLLLWSGVLLCRAETLTVSLTGTSSAEITEEDAPASLLVTYAQTGGNGKGWFTANATADLTLTGMPAGTITSVLVYMKSNKSAGAGQVSLTLGSQSLLSFNGKFADWQKTGFSTTYLPFAAIGSWRVSAEDVLQLHIVSTENSIYLGQVEIEYTPDPPVAQCAEFRRWDGQSLRREVLCESVAGEGVIVPEVSESERVLLYGGQTYRFVGWTNRSVESASAAPYTVLPNQRYYITSPQEILFALYKSQTNGAIRTSNDLTDGEYALALNTGMGTMALAAGRVASGVVPTNLSAFQRDGDGIVAWNTSAVSETLRYRLTVRDDSLTIYHPATNSYLGYNNSGSLSPYERAWAWQAIGKGTIIVFHNNAGSSSKRALCLKESGNDFVLGERVLMWSEENEYLFAFPLTDVPLNAPPTVYTTFPTRTPLIETTPVQTAHKELINGRLVIRSSRGTFNIYGLPIY